ncbi:hypothetical protein [Streptomyces platensis]|uniref:hypothetical protein n=1 Tax=Streptomyces platensis TaxID=58346 RepID=UPI002E7FFD28|nr:hypothetical protein [Streptomyces platensis]WUB80496.1 hypothetical protein OG424_15675 [Streptomyces platensis]
MMTSVRGAMRGPAGLRAVCRRLVFWAYAAFGWLAVSFVWHLWMGIDYRSAMGGADRVPVWGFLAYDGLITAMSAIGAVLALAPVRPWGRRLPPWMVLPPLWFGAVLLVVRGVPGLVENVTTAAGLTPYGLLGMAEQPADPSSGEFWTGMAINTYFFVGAVVLLPLAVLHHRGLRAAGGTGGPAGQEKSAA